jgi:beta-glucosidase
MLEFIVRTPRFAGYKYSNKPDLAGHARLVREATPEGLVLLENDGVLPLKGVKKVALYGVGSYDFIAGGTGSGNVNKAYVRNVAEGLRANGLEVNADIEKWYGQHIALKKTEAANNASGSTGVLLGDAVIPEMEVSRSFIDKMEKVTDIAVLTISRNAGEGGDRKAEDGELFISRVFVDEGATWKRMRPAPQGRGYRIRKRSNHVTLFVDSKTNDDKE